MKHEQFRNMIIHYIPEEEFYFYDTYITSCEETEKRLQELEKDVKRYFELEYMDSFQMSAEEWEEYSSLVDKLYRNKLSTVGVKDE
jgi:coenzyme F420-reducing hydrogenase delta subunit